MWERLNYKDTSIELIYLQLLEEAKNHDKPWSIAELKLSTDDINWLRLWFNQLKPEKTLNCLRSAEFTNHHDKKYATYKSMFGALILCLGAETCRNHSNEHSVWPTIRNIFSNMPILKKELFLSNGQPSYLIKDIIYDAVHALNLRHVMDIEGTQQWYITIKLQFGFTNRGAKSRLAEWLVGLVLPHAVQYLNGDTDYSELSSESFKSLWRALKQFRRGLIGKKETLESIQSSPWIKLHWIDDLLKEAKSKIETLGTGEWSDSDISILDEERASIDDFCPILHIALEWQEAGIPTIQIYLDKELIQYELKNTECSELDFIIDSKPICRWIKQSDDSWAGKKIINAQPETCKNQPNLRPRILTICTRTGEVLFDWDFSDSGLLEDVLIFDLNRNNMLNAGFEQLDYNRHYAVICDKGCNVHGCEPIQLFERNDIPRKVIRLPVPLNQTFSISYNDFILWQPVRPEQEQPFKNSIVLENPVNQILSFTPPNNRTPILIDGLPDGADNVALLIHKKVYDVEYDEKKWQTNRNIMIKPELMLKQLRIRVRFSYKDVNYSIKPQVNLNLFGLAMIQHKKDTKPDNIVFTPLREGDVLNRSEGTRYLRVWTPDKESKVIIFENDIRIGPLKHNKIKLSDFPGHGGEIKALLIDGKYFNFNIQCQDKGCVKNFIPTMMRTYANLFFLYNKNYYNELSPDGYILYEWDFNENNKAKLLKIDNNIIQPTSKNHSLEMHYTKNPMALALTWKKTWCGAYWNLKKISEYLEQRKNLPEHDYAIMKWLRVPVLHPDIEHSFYNAIKHSPIQFLRTWLNKNEFLSELIPQTDIQSCESVIRHFIWNENKFPAAYRKEVLKNIVDCNNHFSENVCCSHLFTLSNISIPLLWCGFKKCIQQCQFHKELLLKSFLFSLVNLPCDSTKDQLDYRLNKWKINIESSLKINSESIEPLINKQIFSLYKSESLLSENDFTDLKKLGEISAGRRYISAKIARFYLEELN